MDGILWAAHCGQELEDVWLEGGVLVWASIGFEKWSLPVTESLA